MSLAMIVRADDGGLGNLTREAFDHLRPDKVLVMMHGHDKLERYGDAPEMRAVPIAGRMKLDEPMWRWLLDGVDTLWSAETFYDERLLSLCALAGVRCVLYAMPELFNPGYRRETIRGRLHVYAPTSWELARLGKAHVLPLPVNVDRLPFRQRTEVKSLLHVSASAMLDRNGTQTFKRALEFVRTPLEVFVSGPNRPQGKSKVGRCTVTPLPHFPEYGAVYDFADALVIPRRYGGLSMPMLEGMACGMPLVTLDRDPERLWTDLRADVVGYRGEPMKGGEIDVASGNPESLARMIDRLAEGVGGDLSRASERSQQTRTYGSWDALLDAWVCSVTP